jgi:hypothetical protein
MFGPRHGSDPRSRLAFLLAAVLCGAGCGEDVFVGRWTLTANLPDASPGEPDAGEPSTQAESADRAARAAREEAKQKEDAKNDGHH